MTPHFLVLAGESRFRVLERFARPGWTSFTLREVVSHDAKTAGHHHRAIDWVAEHIERFLLARPGQAWAFAACPSLGLPVLDGLRPSLRGSMVELVQQDLSAMPGHQVLGFFKSRF